MLLPVLLPLPLPVPLLPVASSSGGATACCWDVWGSCWYVLLLLLVVVPAAGGGLLVLLLPPALLLARFSKFLNSAAVGDCSGGDGLPDPSTNRSCCGAFGSIARAAAAVAAAECAV